MPVLNDDSSKGKGVPPVVTGPPQGSGTGIALPPPGYGFSANAPSGGYGVYGSADGVPGTGVVGESEFGDGVHGETRWPNACGVSGSNNSAPPITSTTSGATPLAQYPCIAVEGSSQNGHGVYGLSGAASGQTPDFGCGVWGDSESGFGVCGASKNNHAIVGETAGAGWCGVQGINNGAGNGACTATEGLSQNGNGVHGVSGLGSGQIPSSVCGVWGDSQSGIGVYGTSKTNHAIQGETTAQGGFGVSGINNSTWPCTAIQGSSQHGHGVRGINGPGSGQSPTLGCGVWGDSESGIGVYGASKTGPAGEFHGDVSVTGNVNVGGDVILTGADCAEQFEFSDGEVADPGTVVVIDANGALRQSHKAYDRRVAGVISGAGDVRPGIILNGRPEQHGRTTVALVGKVYCKADASFGSIDVGDLLTTSPTPGHAMKAADPAQAFGAVIGKALRRQEEGCGLIPILIALQ